MNDLKQTLMIALASFAAMTTTARAEFPEKPITLVEEPLISAPGREGSGSEAAPPWMPQNTIKVAGILSQCLPSDHPRRGRTGPQQADLQVREVLGPCTGHD